MNKNWGFYKARYLLLLIFLFSTHCAYYNTFFNAEENYRIGVEKKNNLTSQEKISKDIIKNFEAAISKSWAVIEIYGDSNSWADDALLLIGKSHYQMDEYVKSQEALEQFLQKYLKSPLRSEAELWLAQTFVSQGKIDEALNSFNNLIAKSTDDDILADAYFNIGEIYFSSGDYALAIDNYQKCIELTSSSETAGNAQYKLADAYFNSDDYEQAVVNYEEVLQFDMPIIKQYDAVIQMSNSLMELNRFDEAEEKLLNIMQDQRFKPHYSMIATKLANMIEFKGDTEFAVDKYYEVMNDFPKSEGAAMASFYIAQIYEFEYGWLDSAKVKYENVKKTYSKAQSAEEASKRAGILTTYLKIRDDLKKDKDDIYKLEHGDSLLIDSLVVQQDSSQILDLEAESGQAQQTEQESGFADTQLGGFGEEATSIDSVQNQQQGEQATNRPKQQKTAVARSPEQVHESLLKNSFNLAEFFLLTYQHSDSALIAYNNFVDNFTDSLLTPKAYYSIYYILNDLKHDTSAADSIKSIILKRYPETIYGKKLSGKVVASLEKDNKDVTEKFLKAEDMVEHEEYLAAIDVYNQIAQQDSGSILAKKSRYATAFIYENYLFDIENAIESYALLAKEYPSSDQAKIAVNKIAEPPEEIVISDSVQVDTAATFSKPDTTESRNPKLPLEDEP